MRVKKYNSSKLITININKYKVDWDNSGASSLETRFRDLIRPFWAGSIILFQFRIPGSLMRIDFLNLNKKLAVEINGPQHDNFNKFFCNNSRAKYLSGIRSDSNKAKWCLDNDIKLLTLIEEDLDWFSEKYIKEKFGIEI